MKRLSTYYCVRIIACLLLCVSTICLCPTLPVYASLPTGSVLQEGTFTTCKWEYRQEEDDVVLHIYPADGSSGTLAKWNDLLSLPPWSSTSREHSQRTKRIVVSGTVRTATCERMFDGFSRVETIDLSGLDTQDATSMKDMFANCSRLKQLDLGKFDTSNVKDMSGMFRACLALTSVGDIGKWNTSAVTNMHRMFSDCNSLSSLAVNTWDTTAVTDICGIFNECHSLASLDLSRWNTSAVTNMKSAFAGCHILTSAGDLSKWDTAHVTDMSCLFFNNPLSVDGIARWNTSAVEDMSFMFSRHHASALPDLSKWDTAAVRNMRHTFSSSHDLTTISGLNKWDTSLVTDMSDLFSNCPNLVSVGDLSTWNTAAVKKMSYMFSGCHNLTSVGDIDMWNTAAVTDMGYLFNSCQSLTSLDLGSWNTTAVKNMSHLFNDCHALTSLKLNLWTVSAACDTTNMFQNTYLLEDICFAHTFHINKNMGLDNAGENTKVQWKHINRAAGGTRDDPRGMVFSSIDELINFHNDATKERTAVEEYLRKVTVPTLMVNFNKGAEDATGTMSPQLFTTSKAKPLTKNAFQRAGHEFSGWQDSKGRSYADEAPFENTDHTGSPTNETFTAQWKVKDSERTDQTDSGHTDQTDSGRTDLPGSLRKGLPATMDFLFSTPPMLAILGSVASALALAFYLRRKSSLQQKIE